MSSRLNEEIGRRVRELRAERGLTLQDLERGTAGVVGFQHLSRMERGRAAWQPHHIEAVALALGVDPRELLPQPDEARTNEQELTSEELELILAFRARDWPRVFRALAMLADVRNGGAGA